MFWQSIITQSTLFYLNRHRFVDQFDACALATLCDDATTWRHIHHHGGGVDDVMLPTDKRQVTSGSGPLWYEWEAGGGNYARTRSHYRCQACQVLLNNRAQSAALQSRPRSSTWSRLSILHHRPAQRTYTGRQWLNVLPVYIDVIQWLVPTLTPVILLPLLPIINSVDTRPVLLSPNTSWWRKLSK